MKQSEFQITLFTSLFVMLWMFSAWSSTVALAQTLTATPTSGILQPTGIYITVDAGTEDHANVRLGPGSGIYPVIGELPNGATAPALGRSPGGDWIQIEFAGVENSVGWVYAPLVILSPGALQVVEPPPTPLPPPTATIDPTLAAQFNILPTNTRLPTFTPPPSLVAPVYTLTTLSTDTDSIPMAVIIMSLGSFGIASFVGSLFFRRR